MDENTKNVIMQLISESRDAVVCSVDEDGFPTAKAMFRRENDGLGTFWFSTNVSAIRTSQFLKNPKSCIYFMDAVGFHGLSLTGTMLVHDDKETKRKFWREGDEMYYSQGPTDPDYCILEFTAEKGNYYHDIQKLLFAVADIF
jgi:general stress protein 26